MKVEHIGIAVNDLDRSIKIYEDLFDQKVLIKEHIASEKVDVAVFDTNPNLELLMASNKDSPISKFIKDKKRDTIHHIAFKTENIEEKLNRLKEKGYKLIEGYPRKGKGNSLVAFLHPGSTGGVLIELVEQN